MMHNLWPTNILIGNIKNVDLVDSISQHILQNYNLENMEISDLSDRNIFKEDSYFDDFKKNVVEPCFDDWIKQILKSSLYDFKNFHLKAWFSGSQIGYNMVNHNHANASLSAVFYLIIEGNKNGDVFFFDPRTNANRGYKEEPWDKLFQPFIFEPKSYSFVVFPSFLYHQVTPFNGNIRLAIPVDLYL
jgi:uncharacterized protein YvpB